MSNKRLNLIYHQTDVAEQDIVDTLAGQVIPELQKLIEAAAVQVAAKYDQESPFTKDAAVDELLFRLACFLRLDLIETPEDVIHISQMTPRHVHAWLDPGKGSK